jgi:hypothetical protein
MMRNTEPIYGAHANTESAVTDLSRIDITLSEYRVLNILPLEGGLELRLIDLRHYLIAKLSETPTSSAELRKWRSDISEAVAEDILKLEHREAIVSECSRIWKKKLLSSLSSVAVESLKFKLGPTLNVAARIDLGFAFEAGIKTNLNWETFLLDSLFPIFKENAISKQNIANSYKIIETEYSAILEFANS